MKRMRWLVGWHAELAGRSEWGARYCSSEAKAKALALTMRQLVGAGVFVSDVRDAPCHKSWIELANKAEAEHG